MADRQVARPRLTVVSTRAAWWPLTRLRNLDVVLARPASGDECARQRETVMIGRGLRPADRAASAIGECVEYQATRLMRPDVVRSMDSLAGRVIDPRLQGLETAHSTSALTVPFDRATPVAWVEARRLHDGASAWLHRPARAGGGFFIPTTNGAAVGADPADAVERAVRELVERHAVTLWWLGITQACEITAWARDVSDVSGWSADNGWGLRWYQLEPELPLPAVLAVAIQRAGPQPRLVAGAGIGTGSTWNEGWTSAVERSAGEIVQAIEAETLSAVSNRPMAGDILHTTRSAVGSRLASLLHTAPAAPRPKVAHAATAKSATTALLDSEVEVWTVGHPGRVDLPTGLAFTEAWSPTLVPSPSASGGLRYDHPLLARRLRERGMSAGDLPRLPLPL
jgi:ribosomal protein S12 methylthiotransferase accessory factor YcaO